MAVPTSVTTFLILNAVALCLSIYFFLSLIIHFRNISRDGQKSSSNVDAQTVERLRLWMTRGAFGAIITTLGYAITAVIHYGDRNISAVGCLASENSLPVFYLFHKLCTYMFIYFRVSTFADFFSESGWKRLKIFAVIAVMIYGVIILVLTPYITFTGQEQFDSSAGWCRKTAQTSVVISSIAGAALVLTDVSIAGVGTISFVRILFCSPTLGQIAKKDPLIARAGKNVAMWSTVALITSFLTLGIAIITDTVGFIAIDVSMNCFCICKQYPDCLTSLLRVLFRYGEEENVEMVTAENADGDDQPKAMNRVASFENA